VVAGGKTKDRKRWCDQDDDNHVLPTSLHLWDVYQGTVLVQLPGHQEEILDIKVILSHSHQYKLVSVGQDGTMMLSVWNIDDQSVQSSILSLGTMVFSVDVLSTRYLVCAVDDCIGIVDLKIEHMVASWKQNSCYCDFVFFVGKSDEGYVVLSRGVEVVTEGTYEQNTVKIHTITLPEEVEHDTLDLLQKKKYKKQYFSDGMDLHTVTLH
jgi:WD40 repeat protein